MQLRSRSRPLTALLMTDLIPLRPPLRFEAPTSVTTHQQTIERLFNIYLPTALWILRNGISSPETEIYLTKRQPRLPLTKTNRSRLSLPHIVGNTCDRTALTKNREAVFKLHPRVVSTL